MTDKKEANANAPMHGQWLRPRSQRGPRAAVTIAANSGSAGMIQTFASRPRATAALGTGRLLCRDCGKRLGGVRVAWQRARRRQLREGRWTGGRLRRRRLVVRGKFLPRLAEVLPAAHVKRVPGAVEDQDQR